MAKKPKSGKKRSADKLTQPTKKEEVELKEDDLNKVAGGLIGLLDKQKG